MPRAKTWTLTPRQREILDGIWRAGQGSLCLVSDVVRQLRVPDESYLTPTLRRMERNGYISIEGGGQRGRPRLVVPTARGAAAMGHETGSALLGVKLAGSASAGAPGGGVLEDEQVIQCSLHPQGQRYRYIRISGDSLNKDGVLDGDVVLAEYSEDPHNGQIVVALIYDGVHGFALKYYYRNPESGMIALVPNSTNPEHRILLLHPDCPEQMPPASELAWLRARLPHHLQRPITRAGVECHAPEQVLIHWVWTGDLIRRKNGL